MEEIREESNLTNQEEMTETIIKIKNSMTKNQEEKELANITTDKVTPIRQEWTFETIHIYPYTAASRVVVGSELLAPQIYIL